MKKLILCLCGWCLIAAPIVSKVNFTERKPIPFQASVIKSLEDPLGYKNLPVTAEILVKDEAGDTLYQETHTATLNGLAEMKLNIGEGTNPSPPFDMAAMEKAAFVCYTVTVHDPEGDVVIMGEDRLGQTLHTISAEQSQNAAALGHVKWGTTPVGPMELYVPPADVSFSVPVVQYPPVMTKEKPTFRQLALRDYVRAMTGPSAVNAMPIDYLQIGTGKPCPLIFGTPEVTEVENFYTIYPGAMEKFYNAFGVKVPSQRGPIGHSSAAVYAEHIYDAQGVGLFANGASRGSYNQGQTGTFGICNNSSGNGAGVWGYVLNAAGTGNGNYALLGSANGLANAYAAYLAGDVYYTGNLMGPSDRNLKTDIRTAALGLSTLMKLRPTTFEYVQNTPYSLPPGQHHGFIAQEVEDVMPEIVKDIAMPQSLDPDQMSSSGTVQYKGINYLELIPVMTKAIQELNTKVDAQAAEIARLRDELKACSKPK